MQKPNKDAGFRTMLGGQSELQNGSFTSLRYIELDPVPVGMVNYPAGGEWQ